MFDAFEDENEDLDEDEDDDDEWVDEEYVHDEDSVDHIKRRVQAAAREYRRAAPPKPPRPPVPPLPPKVPEVIGIRGLDYRKYKLVAKRAKAQGKTISELLNEILDQYLSEEEGYIGEIEALEISEDDLIDLEENIRFVDIDRLTFAPDITRQAFKKIKELRRIELVLIPSHLYLLASKIARDCTIEKYTEDAPSIVEKTFNGDVTLPREFFQVFHERNEQLKLRVYGSLTLNHDVIRDEFASVVHTLDVDEDIYCPQHLIGMVYAMPGRVDGEIILSRPSDDS